MRTVYELQGLLSVRGFYLALVVVVVVVLLGLGLLERRGHRVGARTLAWGMLLLALGAVLHATLRPMAAVGTADPRLVLDPIRGVEGWAGRVAWRPVVHNVGLFLPLGAMAAAAMPRIPRPVLWVLLVGLSMAIEAFQYLVPTGRVANTADVLANAAGAALGLALHALVAPRRPARPRAAPERPPARQPWSA